MKRRNFLKGTASIAAISAASPGFAVLLPEQQPSLGIIYNIDPVQTPLLAPIDEQSFVKLIREVWDKGGKPQFIHRWETDELTPLWSITDET